MALVTFVDDNPPYLNAQNLNNNFNELNQVATTSTKGQMSASDKTKLNRIGMTKLFDGKINAPSTEFTLSQNYDNFDLLIFTCSISSAYKGRVTTFVVIPATIIMDNQSACLCCYVDGDNKYLTININMTNKTKITTGSTGWGTYYTLNRVDGIKF